MLPVADQLDGLIDQRKSKVRIVLPQGDYGQLGVLGDAPFEVPKHIARQGVIEALRDFQLTFQESKRPAVPRRINFGPQSCNDQLCRNPTAGGLRAFDRLSAAT